jgi:hypothetical protein
VPFFGVSNPNKFSARDHSLDQAFVGDSGTTSMSNIRPATPTFQLQPQTPGWNQVQSMSASGVPEGQRAVLTYNGVAGGGVYFPATGTGWRFRRPYWLRGADGTPQQSMALYVRMVGGTWTEDVPSDGHSAEDSLGFYAEFPGTPPTTPLPANTLWLPTETSDTVDPVIPFRYCRSVTLSPTAPTAYNTFSDAPFDQLVTVSVNANTTLNSSATLRLTGGAAFAPGGTGGVVTFIRPGGQSVLYEVSRFNY